MLTGGSPASKGIIQEITIPEGFALDKELIGGLGTGWNCSYRSKRHKDVEIALFYRGSSISAEAAKPFRSLLRDPAETVFDPGSAGGSPAATATDRVEQLGAALGNASDNQFTNQGIGNFGPRFFLERIEIISLNKRSVMSVLGYFHGSDGEVQNHFLGIFIDANPDDTNRCRIEEVVFQAETDLVFKRYKADFDAAINSIRWGEQSVAVSNQKQYKLQF